MGLNRLKASHRSLTLIAGAVGLTVATLAGMSLLSRMALEAAFADAAHTLRVETMEATHRAERAAARLVDAGLTDAGLVGAEDFDAAARTLLRPNDPAGEPGPSSSRAASAPSAPPLSAAGATMVAAAHLAHRSDRVAVRRALSLTPETSPDRSAGLRMAAEHMARTLAERPEPLAAGGAVAIPYHTASNSLWIVHRGRGDAATSVGVLVDLALPAAARSHFVGADVAIAERAAGAPPSSRASLWPFAPFVGGFALEVDGQGYWVSIAAPAQGLFAGLAALSTDLLAACLFVGLTIGLVAALLFRRSRRREREIQERHRQEMKGFERTERALEASEERFRRLAESTNVIPWSADLDNRTFTYVGPQIERLIGYPTSSLRAAGVWAQHIHPGDRRRVVGEVIDLIGKDEYTTLEYRLRGANGDVIHVRNMLTVYRSEPDGADPTARVRTLAQGFLLDISDVKQAQAALQLARRKAEEANRTKSEFLANMSHELRTPLNAVIGFSEIMKSELFGPMPERYRDYATNVHASGRHLLDLINDVLDLSKIEAGRIELVDEETDIEAMLDDCRSLLNDRMAAAGLHNRAEIEPALPNVRLDARRIKQVLLNLLSNSIKFTEPGGSVTTLARRERGRGVLIAVRDTGIGMSAEEIPRALSKYGQIDGERVRQHDGTGLGLPISKSIVEMHGGSFEVSSVKGEGTEVRLWLPESRVVTAAA